MRKLFIVFLCMLALFAVVSCKNEPKKESSDSDGSGASEWEAGTLLVKPGEGCAWSTNNTDRFQFFINQSLAVDDEVTFLVKLSDSFNKIIPRSSTGSSYTKFAQLSVDSLVEEDGWYVVSFTASESCEFIGITCMLKTDAVQSEDLYVGITDLRINEQPIDFDTFADGVYATPFSGAANPDKITAIVTE